MDWRQCFPELEGIIRVSGGDIKNGHSEREWCRQEGGFIKKSDTLCNI